MDLKLSKSKSKYLRSLRRSKQRRLSGKFPVEGEKMCLEIIRDFAESVELVIASPSWISTHEGLLTLVKDRLIPVAEAEIGEHSQLDSPSPVILVCDIPAAPQLADLPDQSRLLYLDGLQDPGNVGTIIRCAAWFGISAICLGSGTVDAYNAKVVQASMGAVLRIPLFSASLAELREHFSDLPAYGLLMKGKNIWSAGIAGPGIMVVGNEGAGIAKAHLHMVQGIHIPGHAEGGVESLNAATAASIALAVWSQKA